MRILTVVNWLNRGGIETMLLAAIPRLRQAGIEMDFCCLGPGTLDAEFAAQGCALWRIPKTGNCRRTAREFQTVVARRRYAAIHSHFGHTSGGFALGAARAGVAIAVSIHSGMALSLYGWRTVPLLRQARSVWLAWHRRLMQRHVNLFVGHSRENLRSFSPAWESDPGRYRVILNGIDFPAKLPDRRDARQQLGIDSRTLLLLHVGSFRPEKNHAGLLEILREVVARRPATQLLLVGDGPLRSGIAEMSQKWGLEGHVRFEGTRADCWPYYAAADVLVFPSITEGFGNVLVEGQGAGLPLVASDIPAHHESVAPSQRPFLFPLPDYGRAAELVLQQAEAARQDNNDAVTAAQAYVRQQFGIERFAADLRNLYLDLQAG